MASRSFHSLHFWRFFSHRPRLVFSLLLIIFIVWLAGCAGNPPKDDIPGDTQSEAGTNIPSEPDQTIQADWSIQRFSTTNANGDEITLTIPAFSITPDDVIELIPLDSPPPGPFAQSEFPGVLIQPSGLRLPAAAYLDITLANSPTNLAESPTTWLFKAVDSNYAIPLATELLDDGRTLRTQLYSFSTIFAATPTAEEVETIYEIIEGRLETLPRDFADLVDVVVVCAGHIKQLRLFGNFAEAGSLHERLFKKILDDREIVLTLPQGTDPCYAYLPMLLKFRQGLGILLEPLLEVMDRIVQNPNLYPDETAANAAFDEAFYFVGARPLAEKILDFNEENAQQVDAIADNCPIKARWQLRVSGESINEVYKMVPGFHGANVTLKLTGTAWLRLDNMIRGSLTGKFEVADPGGPAGEDPRYICEVYESGPVAITKSVIGGVADSLLYLIVEGDKPVKKPYSVLCQRQDDPGESIVFHRLVISTLNGLQIRGIESPYSGEYIRERSWQYSDGETGKATVQLFLEPITQQ